MTAFDSAVVKWREIVGDEFITLDRQQLNEASTATFPTSGKVTAIIHPVNQEQVLACVQVASQWHVPIYPISAGKNWGYGSKVPHVDCALFMLDRLDQIVSFDSQLALITIQPGVTFEQVQAFLDVHAPHLMLNAPGSTSQASVIGNALERGFAPGLANPSVDYVSDLEVILPDGSVIHTGFSKFANAKVHHHYGVGAALDGLFAQSNFGIVTAMTIWLALRPAYSEYVTFSILDIKQLPALIDTLQCLKLSGVVQTNIALFNQYKLIASGYPTDDVWVGEFSITAPTPEIGLMIRQYLRDMLKHKVSVLDFSPPDVLNPMFDTNTKPDLASVYWRKSIAPGTDPDRDRCGVIWFAPVVPFRGEDVACCLQMIAEKAREAIISIQCFDARSCVLVVGLIYDREIAGQDESAMACYSDLSTLAAKMGFYPYRLGLQGELPAVIDDTADVMRRIKQQFDPADILAPNRYDFREQWT